MAGAAREQPPHQRVHRALVALDQIAPRALLATLRTAERELVEPLRSPHGGRLHRYRGITRDA